MEAVSYRITESDYAAFAALHFKRAFPKFALIVFLGVLAIVIALIAVFSQSFEEALREVLPALIGGVLGLVILWPICAFLLVPAKARKLFRKYKLIQEEMTLTLSQDVFSIHQASGSVTVRWSDLDKWDEDETCLALYPTQGIAYLLPKHSVSETYCDYARQSLVKGGLPHKGKKRK